MPGSRGTIAADGTNGASARAVVLYFRWFPWLVIAYMTWFALHFAVERLHGDPSYFLLRIVDEGKFYVNNGRWVMPMGQWAAVAGVHLGLPLSAVIHLYSMGATVTSIASFLFVTRVLGDREAGIAVVAVQFVGLAHALFCPVFELYYGAMLLVVFIATLRTQRIAERSRRTLLAVLFVLVISSHFMGLLLTLMTLLLERIWTDRRTMLMLMALLALHLWMRLQFLSTYEQNAFSVVFLRFEQYGLTWLFVPGRWVAMAFHGATAYPDTFVIALITSLTLAISKDVRGLALFLVGILALYVVLGLYFPDGTHMIYREIVDYPISIWVLLVLWRRVLVHHRHIRPALILLFLAFGFRVVQPLRISVAYTERVSWMMDRIAAAQEQDVRRGMVLNVPTFQPADGGQALPGLDPVQAILISACDGPDAVVVLVPGTDAPGTMFAERWIAALEARGERLPQGRGTYFNMPDEPFEQLR